MQEPVKSEDDQINDQRTENELKKIKLSLEHGMDFSHSYTSPDLPPEVEGEFLDHMQQWEEQFALRKRIAVYDFVERPEFTPVADIGPGQLKYELERILEKMNQHGVFLDTLCEVDDVELYRFITEELFKEEMDDIRIEGMMHCFTYEEYHPNHEYDIKRRCMEFVEYLFDKRDDVMESLCLADNIQCGEKVFTKVEFGKKLNHFRNSFSAFTLDELEVRSIELNETKDDAEATYNIHYSGNVEGSHDLLEFKGACKLWLKREEEWWEVYKYEIPGVVV